jgi:hypothetical protein
MPRGDVNSPTGGARFERDVCYNLFD